MGTNEREFEGVTTWTIGDIGDLTLECRLEAGTVVAKAIGRVDGVNSLKFQDALTSVLEKNVTAFVLDLEHLSYISSAGLRVILVAARDLQERTGKFAVCALSDAVADVFRISGFDNVVPTYATQPEALSALTE